MESEGARNYFPQHLDSSTGFRYRVDGSEIIKAVMDSLRGGVGVDKYGKKCINTEHALMNDLGIARIQSALNMILNKNTILSKYPDQDTINETMKRLARELVMTMALNHKKWETKDPDLVQIMLETTIMASLQRANDGFEAELSGKNHSVVENVGQQRDSMGGGEPGGGGLFSRINPWRSQR